MHPEATSGPKSVKHRLEEAPGMTLHPIARHDRRRTIPWSDTDPVITGAERRQPAPPPPESGVFESIGRWFDQGATNFRDRTPMLPGRIIELSATAR